MQFYYFYIASAIAVALGYMLFDVLNNREVPNMFAYATLLFSFAAILLTWNWHLILQSYLISLVILAIGYFIYKVGQLGLGDVFEFAALALLLAPITSQLLYSVPTWLMLPPVVALLLDTGIAAIIVVPVFYVALAIRKFGWSAVSRIRKGDLAKAAVVVLAYLLFAALLSRISPARDILFVMLFVIIAGSTLLMLFERVITEVMVDRVGVSGFTEDDIIAFNLMSDREIASAKRRIKSFDRLVTKQMISEMSKKRIKAKYPVYKRAVPFAVPIFLGTILTILFGNLLLVALFG
jgi:hypothetical protein